MDTETTSDFRSYLQTELIRRCKINSRYSLRAFALTLGIQSSFLSKIISGKRAVTLKTIERLAAKMDLTPQEISHFKAALVGLNVMGPRGNPKYADLSMDAFTIIADWYHFAILELATTDGFKWDSRWIGNRFGLSPIQVADALARMARVGLLERKGKSYLIKSGQNSTLKLGKTDAALKRMQRQVLEMAIQAMEETPIELRDQTTMTMAIDTALLPAAKQRITAFRRELCDYLQRKRVTDSVYHFTISLYPITKPIQTRRKTDEKLH